MKRKEAIKYLIKPVATSTEIGEEKQKEFEAYNMAIEALSADVEPTVIRSRTLMPTKDFKEWAKRIKEVNPNAVVIPCDAEVVSADVVQGEWILVKGNNGKDYHKCSKCLHTQEITGIKNYCAVCGARMKGGAE